MTCSWGAVAELSRQKASSASATPAPLPLCRWCHASSAHTAPPDVPLRPTTSYPLSSSARRSLLSTPAVNAVWLPPPWQAIAIRFLLPAFLSPASMSSSCNQGSHQCPETLDDQREGFLGTRRAPTGR